MREERHYRRGEEYIRELEKEIAFEDSLLNEEERRARDKEYHERIRRAIDKAQHIQNASRFIVNGNKMRKFQEIYENMFDFAEKMLCDIVVESDEETSGTITLYFDCLILDREHMQDELRVFWDMLSNADMTVCHTKDGIVKLRSHFPIADKIYMKSLL